MQQLSNAFVALSSILLSSSPYTTTAQTTVGCSATCPPLGYETDSSHLCPGNIVDSTIANRDHTICHPATTQFPNNKLNINQFQQSGYVTVIANYYTGCEAGRRESGVYAGLAQRIHDATAGKINFITSLKGGGNCNQWAGIYQSDALSMGLNGGVKPSSMPLTLSDDALDIRDYYFTPPYPHPSCTYLCVHIMCSEFDIYANPPSSLSDLTKLLHRHCT